MCSGERATLADDRFGPYTEQHDAAAVAQLFECGQVVWWRIPSLLHGLGCEVVPGGGSRLFLVPVFYAHVLLEVAN